MLLRQVASIHGQTSRHYGISDGNSTGNRQNRLSESICELQMAGLLTATNADVDIVLHVIFHSKNAILEQVVNK